MKIKRFISSGDLDVANVKDTKDLIKQAAYALDRAYAADILGDDAVLFEGEDGKIYCMTVEAVIDEANPDYVEEVLTRIAEEEE